MFKHGLFLFMHLSMLSPRGGPRAYVGHLTSIAFPTLGNLTENLGPRVGTFGSFARKNGTKSHRPMCSSVFRCVNGRCHLIILITKPFRMDNTISALV